MDSTAAPVANSIIEIESDVTQIESIIGPVTTETNTVIEMAANSVQTVRVLNMGGTSSQKLEQMKKQGRSILILCLNSRARIASNRAEEMRNRFLDARLYLDWLDTNVEMTPRINTSTGVKVALMELIKPTNNAPEELIKKAQDLLTKYEAENWGRDVVADEDPDAASNAQSLPSAEPSIGEIQVPPANDPIFGVGGIMYGIIVDTSGKRKDYRLRADLARKSFKVYGHNDIPLGAWYPFQINALFWGAHGSRMGGIAGSVITGAWSIVVAGTYEDLDTDHGNTLYYSGSNSHDNTNPHQAAPASQGTKALQASYASQNPVRVLRSGGAFSTHNHNPHLPSCGLRYDGLYRVSGFQQRRNQKGGLYDQFKLVRLPGQTALGELQRSSPTTEQVFARDRLERSN